jgi:hypothetical protein
MKTPIVIMTSANWWNFCTEGKLALGSRGVPLWVIDHSGASSPALPVGWKDWNFWQIADGDQFNKDLFNGTPADLDKFAKP